jgi:hypothetical protein
MAHRAAVNWRGCAIVGSILQRPTLPAMQRFAALALTLALCATAQADDKPIRLTIAPGKVGEVCLPLEAGDTLAWHFKASAPADFNLHQHVGNEVLTPVNRKAVAEDRAEHAVERKNEWCLMWTAPPGARLTVSGGWSVKKAK